MFAHIIGAPDVGGVGIRLDGQGGHRAGKGALEMQFFGETLIPKELEIMNAVKSGNIAMGSPAGAAATVFPEMGALLVPYLVKDYARPTPCSTARSATSSISRSRTSTSSRCCAIFDYGFRHFWTNKKPIVEPKDLRGKKIRVQQAKVFGDTINGLGGNAVPMAWGEVVTAAKQGVIDGGDLPIVNIEGAEDLRSVEIRLADLSQLRPDQRGDEPRHLERAVAPSNRS